MKTLTKEQNKVLDFIMAARKESGAPPTVREIAAHFGYRSPNNVRQHLRLIEQKGYIRRLPGRARGIEVLVRGADEKDARRVDVPIIGDIAAGTPITAVENLVGMVTLDRDLFKGEGLFSLRVRGDSMKDAGILDGDLAVIRSQASVADGEIGAVVIDGEATLKRIFRRTQGLVLRAENEAYADIEVASDREVQIAGRLAGVVRKCRY